MKVCMRNYSHTFSNTFRFSSGRPSDLDLFNFLDYTKRISTMLLKIIGFFFFLFFFFCFRFNKTGRTYILNGELLTCMRDLKPNLPSMLKYNPEIMFFFLFVFNNIHHQACCSSSQICNLEINLRCEIV